MSISNKFNLESENTNQKDDERKNLYDYTYQPLQQIPMNQIASTILKNQSDIKVSTKRKGRKNKRIN